ncbi:conjugative relaxase domain-containing protein, TrwC/TraI family [Roseomonas rosea]|uniref:Conjugative relaxase domain-containing protein, TrwC/TraI family n=1 Tax=Muricoccus roseus TaxID=198092 RepID=A0A1M6R249_9PROT|nr:MobF family relaxase [Roseomonas rosea]SHK26571.1 conjugative relaxase domain-containing protein, TrwC/TraI family [Roseomonas rosea]
MLTFRKGAATVTPGGARAMADHLMEETLSPEAVAMGDYYTRNRAAELGAGKGPDGEPGPEAPRRGTRPQPRRDMHPGLAAALGLDPHGTPTVEQVSQILAGRRADGGELATNEAATTRSVSYIDLCFSAPKSVSLAWAFAPTEAERATILQAHRDAVDASLRYVAREIGQVRRGKAGSGGTEAGHIAWIGFEHFTARPTASVVVTDQRTGENRTEFFTLRMERDPSGAGDPQLHTHCAVPNLVLTDGGHLGALDLNPTRTRIHEFGAFYQAQIAANLRRVGVAVELEERTGMARLPAIPEAVCEAFSKRTRDGTEAAREEAAKRGLDWDAMTPDMQVDFLKGGTKAARKSKADDLSDFAAWRGQAAAVGWQHRGVVAPQRQAAEAPREQSRAARLEAGYEAALPFLEAEFSCASVLNGADLRAAAARALIAAGMTPGADGGRADVDALTRTMRERGVRQDGQLTGLVWGRDGERDEVKVTTALHVAQEGEAVALAKAAAADRSRALSPAALAAAVERSGLDFGDDHGKAQHAAMLRLGTGGAVGVAVGVAGSGKTALLRPLVDAWKAQGDNVVGVAIAWRQAEPLKEAGVGSVAALTGFLHGVKAGRISVGTRTVVVVDELGQVGARQMLELLRLREQHGFRIVAVGDDKQCQGIEAGPVVNLMRRALGPEAVPEILTTRRQRTEREREIAGLFRDGKAAEALAMKREDGTAEAVPGGYDDAVRRVAELWRQRREANAGDAGFSISVTAPTNADARAVSLALREERRAMGELGADVFSVRATDQAGAAYNLTLAPGDRVRLFDRLNARFLDGGRGNIGNNGSVLEVRDVTADGIVLRTAAGRDGAVSWESLADKKNGRTRLAPGDVLTIDAAQGITSSEHINAMPAGSAGVQGFKGYTAESRHKDSAFLITSDGAERREVMVRRALGDARPVGEGDVWENVARNLARQPAKASALDFMDRARDIGRSAAHAMQAGFRRAEAREVAGEPRATLGAQLRDRRDGRAVGQAVERLRQALDARWQAVRELAERLRRAGGTVLQDRGREDRWPAEGEARAVRDRARDNRAQSRAAAERHRAPRPKQADQARPVDAAAYWRRTAAGAKGAPRPSVRRAAQRKREEGAVAAVADRLALALDERGAVLAGMGQGRGQKPAQAAQEPRQGRDGVQAPARPVEPAQSIPAPAPRAAAAPGRREAPRFMEADAAADFAVALHRAGLRVAGPVEMDGKMHRVPVERDRKGQKSGTYVGHLDGWPAGYIRNHKTGTEIRWKAERPVAQMAPAERATFAAEAAARSAERARERHDTQERAARMAHRLWAAAAPATSHPYLAAKGVRAHGLRQDRRGRLLVPVQGADGRLWGVQRVDVDGSKLFLKGARTEGGHALIGGRPRPGEPLLIAEGYATGATLHEATGLPVAVAFNAGNLAAVAKAYRAADPSRLIVIAGDNDHHLPRRAVPLPNVGKEKAEAAAKAVGGAAAVPFFPSGDRGSDWNDLARRQGHQSVAAAVRGVLDHLQRVAADRVELAAAAATAATERQEQEVRARGLRM